jgi:gentisate 1,2-dioxygenase
MKEEEKHPQWLKERFFVRAVSGKYDEIYKRLYEQPRVIHTREVLKEQGGKGMVLSPSLTDSPLVTQAMEVHINLQEPGTRAQKHGHLNSAVMYVLEGKGYDIHDRQRLDWRAGDVLIVENNCVHQHFNLDPNKPAALLVIKSKPLFLFFNLVFQKTVKLPVEAGVSSDTE